LSREDPGDGIAGIDAVLGHGAEVGSDAAELNGASLGSESAGWIFTLNSVVDPIYLAQTNWASSVVARQLFAYQVNAEIR